MSPWGHGCGRAATGEKQKPVKHGGGRNDRLADTAPKREADHRKFNRRSLTGIIPARSIPTAPAKFLTGANLGEITFVNIHATAPQALGATGIPVNRQSLASRRAFSSSFFALAIVFAMMFGFSCRAQAQLLAPGGRLTLVSGQPIMKSDVTGATTIYYTPF